MSNYTVQVSWNGKDALGTTDPEKIISGDDLATEFTALQTAVNSKVDTTSGTTSGHTLINPVINTGVTGTAVLDEDNMASNSATKLATQQSIKAYADGLKSTSANLTNKTITSPVLNTGVSGSAVLDEDNLASNSATKLATQQSIKAYADSLKSATETLSNKSLNLNSNTVTGTLAEFNTAVSNANLASLAGSETLTNKTLTSAILDTAVSGSAFLDEDNFASNSATKVASQQSIKAYVDSKPGVIGALAIGNNLSDLSNVNTARSNLGVAIGTNVLAPNGDGSNLTGVDPQLGFKNVSSWQDSAVETVTLDNAASAIGKADVSVWEEIPDVNKTNSVWDIVTNDLGFDLVDSASSVTLTPAATTGTAVSFTLGSGNWATSDIAKRIVNGSASENGEARILSVSGAVATCEITTTFTNTDAIASGDWELYSGEFRSGSFELGTATGGAANRHELGELVTTDTDNTTWNAVAALSETKAILCFSNGTNGYGHTVVMKIHGNTLKLGSQAVFESATVSFISVAALSSTKAIVTYTDGGNSNFGTACILDVNGSVVTPATPSVITSTYTTYHSVAKLTATKAIVCYRLVSGSSPGTAVILDVNGSAITPATPVAFESGSTEHISVAALSPTKAIVTYQDAGNSSHGTACILDVSTSAITPATPSVFESANTQYTSVVSTTATQAVVAYYDSAASTGNVCVLNVSTSAITPVTPVVFSTEPVNSLSFTAPLSTTLVLAGNQGDSPRGFYCVIDLSGNTLTPAPEVSFHPSVTSSVGAVAVSSSKIVIAYRDGASPRANYGTAKVLDLDAPVGDAVSAATQFESGNTSFVSLAMLSTTKAIIAYNDDNNSARGTAVIVDIANGIVTVGTPAVFDSTSSCQEISISTLSSTKAIVTYSASTTRSCILNVSNSTVNPGSVQQIDSGGAGYTSVVALTATKAICCYNDSNNTAAGTSVILDVSGTTITVGSAVVFQTTYVNQIHVVKLTSTQAMVSFSHNGQSNFGKACILDVSTSTISAGTVVTYDSVNTGRNELAMLTSTQAIAVYNNGVDSYAVILNVSSSAITAATPFLFAPGASTVFNVIRVSDTKAMVSYSRGAGLNATYITLSVANSVITSDDPQYFTGGPADYPVVGFISPTQMIIAYQDGDGKGYVRLIDKDAAYKSSVPKVVFNGNNTNGVQVTKLTATKALIVFQDAAGGGYMSAVVAEIIGGTVIIGTKRTIYSNVLSQQRIGVDRLSDTSAIVVFRDNTGAGRTMALGIIGTRVHPVGSTIVFDSAPVNYVSVTALSPTLAIACYNSNTSGQSFGSARAIVISGTTVTTPTAAAVFESATTQWTSVTKLSATKALVTYRDGGNSHRGTASILNVSGTTITPVTPVVFESTNPVSYVNVTTLSASRALVVYLWSPDGPAFARAALLDVSGNTITPVTPVQLHSSDGFTAVDTVSSSSAIMRSQKSGIGVRTHLLVTGSTISVELSTTTDMATTTIGDVAQLSDNQAIMVGGHPSSGFAVLIDKLSSPSFVVDQFVTTISGSDSIDSTFYSDWNSNVVTETLNGQTALYAFSTNSTPSAQKITGGTFGIIKSGQSAVRKIASSLNSVHGGTNNVWFINTNSTYGSETWAAATTNEAKAAIQQASAVSNNQMSGTEFAGISDANLPAFGTQLSLAITLKSTDATATPSVDKVLFNYDANVINRDETDQYIIEMPATNTIRVTAPSSGTSRNARIYVSK